MSAFKIRISEKKKKGGGAQFVPEVSIVDLRVHRRKRSGNRIHSDPILQFYRSLSLTEWTQWSPKLYHILRPDP